MLDEVEVRDGISYGKRLFKGDEFFFDGHFPGNPIVPGVILCEIMAQSACALVSAAGHTSNTGNTGDTGTDDAADDAGAAGPTTLFTGLDKVRFKKLVRPGDIFSTECEIVKKAGHFYFAKAKGFVEGKLAVSAEFSFALIPQNLKM